jgi:hypothetical protein
MVTETHIGPILRLSFAKIIICSINCPLLASLAPGLRLGFIVNVGWKVLSSVGSMHFTQGPM